MSNAIKECKVCKKSIRSDNMNRHFSTHIDELFLTLDLKYINAAIYAKTPVLYCKDNNNFVDYSYCLDCNKGCYYDKDGKNKAGLWLKKHIISDCSKHWSTHQERFERSMNRQEMTEIEVPNSTSATSQVLKENDGTELAKVQEELSTIKEDLVISEEGKQYYEQETKKLREMRSKLQEWYTKLDTKIIDIRRQLGDSDADIAVNDALNEVGEVLDEFSLDTEA